MVDEGLLRSYEGLLTAEEHAHMLEGSTPAVRKERLLARVLVRTTLSRCAHCPPSFQKLRRFKTHVLRRRDGGCEAHLCYQSPQQQILMSAFSLLISQVCIPADRL